MTGETKPKWIHPLVRKMKAYRERHPEMIEHDLDEMMFGSVLEQTGDEQHAT